MNISYQQIACRALTGSCPNGQNIGLLLYKF